MNPMNDGIVFALHGDKGFNLVRFKSKQNGESVIPNNDLPIEYFMYVDPLPILLPPKPCPCFVI